MPETRPRVVILGAGFGGLECAKALNRANVAITIIDRQNYHCFQPLLYQVATAALSPADVAWPIRHILRKQQNATVFMAEVTGIDATEGLVKTKNGSFRFDYLVIATGAAHWYFGNDAWAAFAPGLKRIEDATRIRRTILSAFERAELADDDSQRQRSLTFVIVGGGPTGVEMAGAIAEVAQQTLTRDFRRIDPRTSRIVLIEAGPRLLPGFSEQHSRYAQSALTAMGVDVLISTRVTGCDADGVDLEHGRIDAGAVVWAAGVMASPASGWLAAEHDKVGRVVVRPDLSLPGHEKIFVIGDTASVQDAAGHPVPGLAPAAKQMGNYVGRLIATRVANGTSPPPFRYRNQGALATIGRRAAIVELGPIQLKGYLGWLFWSVAHIYFLIGSRNRFVVAVTWLWGYITFQRSARLITDPPPPNPQC
ncbi:MAG TPA: NAD(P)/FAD-dependent oxidoreductase [Xanthobacteraceae bacterium]|nr:NAD(P)/FAD-dependent oxidoreductase [Xanthobacteraceae bacterium]